LIDDGERERRKRGGSQGDLGGECGSPIDVLRKSKELLIGDLAVESIR
jgi:hypothetical protein